MRCRRMSAIARQILLHLGAGAGVAGLFLGAMLATDPALARLLLGAEQAPMPLLLLWLFVTLTFAAAQFALGVGAPGGAARQRPRGGAPARLVLRPAPVRIPARRPRR